MNENIALLLPLVALVFTGVGYLIKRQLTGERHREEADSIERAIQLKRLLDAEGMSLEDAVRLRDQLRGGRGAILTAEARALVAQQSELSETAQEEAVDADPNLHRRAVPYEDTTVGMSFRLAAELNEFSAQLDLAVADMAHVSSEGRAAALHEAQEAWETYRDKEAEFAGFLFEGGTGAPLLAAARKIELTERRLTDLRFARAEVENLTGE